MTEKVWKFFNFSTADPSLASSHWMRPDLDAPGCCLFLEDLILIVFRIQQIHLKLVLNSEIDTLILSLDVM